MTGARPATGAGMRCFGVVLCLSFTAFARDGGWVPTRPLLEGHGERVVVSRAVPLVGVLSTPGDGGVEHTLVLERGLLDEVGFTTSPEASLVVYRLRTPARATLEITAMDGGVQVRGADVERVALPARPGFMNRRARSLSVKLLRPDVLMLTDIEGGGCPTTDVVRFLLLEEGVARVLLQTQLSGEAGFWRGTRAFWGARAGAETDLAGFPSIELVAGVPAGELVTTIEQWVDDEVVKCATRRRYRFTGASLKPLDVTHAPDAGCVAGE